MLLNQNNQKYYDILETGTILRVDVQVNSSALVIAKQNGVEIIRETITTSKNYGEFTEYVEFEVYAPTGSVVVDEIKSEPTSIINATYDSVGNIVGFLNKNGSIEDLHKSDNQTSKSGFKPSRIIASANHGIGVTNGWGVSNATLTIDTANSRVAGRPVLKIDATGTSGEVITDIRKAIPAIALTGKFENWIKLPNYQPTNIELYFGFSATAPSADPPTSAPSGNRQIFSNISELAKDSWTCLTYLAGTGSKRYSTGNFAGRSWLSDEALPSTVRYVEYKIIWKASHPSAQRIAYLDCMAINGYTKPMLMIGFDGLYDSNVSWALPVLREIGVAGYNGGSGNGIVGAGLNNANILYANGWDIIHQAQRSADYGVNQTNLASDIDSAVSQLAGAGFTRALKCFTYPFNSRSSASDAILASKGILLAGSTNGAATAQSQLGCPLMTIGRYPTDLGNTAVNMQAMVDNLIAEGSHGMWFGHDLVATVTNNTIQTDRAQWSTAMNYVADKYYAGLIDIVTPSEFLNRV